jgi:glyoxylase-like metal-dependent hydrolase (beta-lactamase superfamily II)
MNRTLLTLLACGLLTAHLASQGQPAAGAQAPQITATKVEGTDGVYTFRNGNSQAMFIVTNEGVIATDPVGYGRPTGGADYLAEIKKVTSQPIRYVIYSHHHFDHIAGGQAFKQAGARFVAHRRAKERLEVLKDPHTVLPDETVDNRRTITLGGTSLELTYIGPNHSDSTLVMRLPKERIVYVVDLLPVGQVPGRGLIDFYPLEAEASIKQIMSMDWERLIPGHPGVGGRLGTKKDVQDQLTFLQDVSAAVKAEAQKGRCWEPVEK